MFIKVGFLVSYDYKYLENSLLRVYPYADYIAIAVDKERKTWNGETFDIPISFFEWIKEIDTKNKIHIYEDIFSVSELTPMECETRERNMLAQFMGSGGWHVQVDSDEYFFDFGGFCNYLRSLDINRKVNIFGRWITIFKQNGNDFFLVKTNETFPVATNTPQYIYARMTDKNNNLYTDYQVLHQSWARDDDEILQKLRNWGHKNDFDIESYYNFWKNIDKCTYRYARSFHPLDPWLWPSLEYFEATNINELITKVSHFLEERKKEETLSKKLKIEDFVPPVLYKLKALLSNFPRSLNK